MVLLPHVNQSCDAVSLLTPGHGGNEMSHGLPISRHVGSCGRVSSVVMALTAAVVLTPPRRVPTPNRLAPRPRGSLQARHRHPGLRPQRQRHHAHDPSRRVLDRPPAVAQFFPCNRPSSSPAATPQRWTEAGQMRTCLCCFGFPTTGILVETGEQHRAGRAVQGAVGPAGRDAGHHPRPNHPPGPAPTAISPTPAANVLATVSYPDGSPRSTRAVRPATRSARSSPSAEPHPPGQSGTSTGSRSEPPTAPRPGSARCKRSRRAPRDRRRCARSQLTAVTHHRSPGCRPGNRYIGIGVDRSLPIERRCSRNPRSRRRRWCAGWRPPVGSIRRGGSR